MKLIFATQNLHKRDEVQSLLGGEIIVTSLADLHFSEDLAETHATLEENALEKAMFISNRFGMDCFAEDTGLEVESLQGAPGVYSARYAGEGKQAEDNIRLLLHNLGGNANRRARFRTVICLYMQQRPYYFEGIVNGSIANSPSGSYGFGYDPVFIPEGSDRTFAVMTQEEKNAVSHRRKAIDKMIRFLKDRDQ
ncbi:MAG: RdgB/HAM1 family non-canonical purine NTP pyrophosphatase [Chitinophagales bacterium]|nr:RdgB/HAM1 family non-canonical purine NTP pyrophosphatase [Chitinophagales bacterium]